jgi:hypothetical protein
MNLQRVPAVPPTWWNACGPGGVHRRDQSLALAVFHHLHDSAGVLVAAISKHCVHEVAFNHTCKATWLLTWQADDAGLIQFW